MNQDLMKEIDTLFTDSFGKTPLKERIADIERECLELSRFTDLKSLKEEAGDLLTSLLQLYNENEWNPDDGIKACLAKIRKRQEQYHALGRKVKVAILGGAFDPITVGHIQVAQYVLNNSKEFDEVWLMPCFRHMYGKRMNAPEHRFAMCELAAAVDRRISVSNYEIKNQLAGETYHLIKRLVEEPLLKDRYTFAYIIGQDNANTFDKWVNYEFLERAMQFVVIPRKGIPFDQNATWYLKPPHIFMSGDTGIMEVSSTLVRTALKNDDASVNQFLNPAVLNYIKEHNLY